MLCINYLSIIIIEKQSIRNIWRQKQYFPLKVGVCPGADCVAACGDCPVTAARSRTLAPLLPRTQCWLVRAEISLKIDHTHTPDTPDILHYCRFLYCLALRQSNAKYKNFTSLTLSCNILKNEDWRANIMIWRSWISVEHCEFSASALAGDRVKSVARWAGGWWQWVQLCDCLPLPPS